MRLLLSISAFLTLVYAPQNAFAQNPQVLDTPPEQKEVIASGVENKSKILEAEEASISRVIDFYFKQFPSLLFTYGEQEAIDNARRSDGLKALPTDGELNDQGDIGQKVKPPPEKRFINLAGISYKSAKNWTIWLNKQRVTPKSIPPEILDLKVFKDYVEIQWFDEYTNQIFPIRLRAQERFNIDTKTFLPG